MDSAIISSLRHTRPGLERQARNARDRRGSASLASGVRLTLAVPCARHGYGSARRLGCHRDAVCVQPGWWSALVQTLAHPRCGAIDRISRGFLPSGPGLRRARHQSTTCSPPRTRRAQRLGSATARHAGGSRPRVRPGACALRCTATPTRSSQAASRRRMQPPRPPGRSTCSLVALTRRSRSTPGRSDRDRLHVEVAVRRGRRRRQRAQHEQPDGRCRSVDTPPCR